MRVNIGIQITEPLGNYLNLCPFFTEEKDNVKRCDIQNIDDFVDNGEAEEILVVNTLTYFSVEQIPAMLSNWVGKMAIGGKIIIQDVDIHTVTRLHARGNITDTDLNQLLYGNSSNGFISKQSCFSVLSLANYLQSHNLKIVKQDIQNVYGIVIAERVS